MVKRWLILGVVLAAVTQSLLAGTFYVAPSYVLNNYTSKNGSYLGSAPRVGVGYSAMITPGFFLAGEAFGSYGSLVSSDHHLPGTDSVRPSQSFGLGALPGVRLSKDTLGFVRLGLVETKFATGPKSRLGTQLGLGLETELSDCWDVRLEYDYSHYNSLSAAAGIPRGDSYMLGFVRRFY